MAIAADTNLQNIEWLGPDRGKMTLVFVFVMMSEKLVGAVNIHECGKRLTIAFFAHIDSLKIHPRPVEISGGERSIQVGLDYRYDARCIVILGRITAGFPAKHVKGRDNTVGRSNDHDRLNVNHVPA